MGIFGKILLVFFMVVGLIAFGSLAANAQSKPSLKADTTTVKVVHASMMVKTASPSPIKAKFKPRKPLPKVGVAIKARPIKE